MERIVRVFRDPRKETSLGLAGRWKAMLDGFAALLPAASCAPRGQPWTWAPHHACGRPTELRSDVAEPAAALQADHDSPRTSDGAGPSPAVRASRAGRPPSPAAVAGSRSTRPRPSC